MASVTLSIPLAFEVLEPNAMRRIPRSPDEPVFSGFIVARLIMTALLLREYFRIIGPEPVTTLFASAALDVRAWLYAMAAGAIVLPVISPDKWFRNHRRG